MKIAVFGLGEAGSLIAADLVKAEQEVAAQRGDERSGWHSDRSTPRRPASWLWRLGLE
jgi:3-hydroxyisobutyrate dehydrogenase-like beta-hydroxyacid dehydrogenase